jgi:hypothetical protein
MYELQHVCHPRHLARGRLRLPRAGEIRFAVEHATAHLKTWRILSEDAGRYRPPSANTKGCSGPSLRCSSSHL